MKGKVLIAEDDIEIARIIKEHLSRLGYEIKWASTGIEALDEFKKEQYDLLLVDIMMPEMDGFTLCKNIRWTSEVPILILSARKEEVDKVKGLKIGADDYITKPFSLVELEARVERHIRRYRKYDKAFSSEEVFKYNEGLVINKEMKVITLNDNVIELTSKEYSILILMVQNENRVFTKGELYENVWNQCDIDGNNTVTVHVKELREKLKDNPKSPKFIQTVWGTGYKFIGERML